MTFWRFFRAWGAREAGRWCRHCLEPIAHDDPFGRSEGVCEPCRAAAD